MYKYLIVYHEALAVLGCIIQVESKFMPRNPYWIFHKIQNSIQFSPIHHKSHQGISKFFWIDIEPLRKFLEIYGVWPICLLDGTSFIITRIKVNHSKIWSYTKIFEKILINFQTRNFWSNSEPLGGFCGVEIFFAWLVINPTNLRK